MSKAMTGSKTFIDVDRLKTLAFETTVDDAEVKEILNKSMKLKGLPIEDVAKLLQIQDDANLQSLLEAAEYVKTQIYGNRMVLFAPMYTGNVCSNNCLYCGFRKDNKDLLRKNLSMKEIEQETIGLLKQGHKRMLLLCGESAHNSIENITESIRTVYAARWGKHSIRRINIEVAPLSVEEFKRLNEEKIGTYACFQETYDPDLYQQYHLSGPKADYEYRLNVMDRAMEAGIDDVGIGVLYGLADYRFDTLAIFEHARHLEEKFGCGPHTVSVPRIEPADGAPLTEHIPHQVSDQDFKKIIAIIRIALPYTGIILTTRESEKLRNEIFRYGVSQISAGSRTNPGAYASQEEAVGAQFSLGDHRNLDEVISKLIEMEYIPSFCTGCYRKGRTGQDFMDLAKPGLIHQYCKPNAVFTFQEYLEDFATPGTKEKGYALVDKIIAAMKNENLKKKMSDNVDHIKDGSRDVYF